MSENIGTAKKIRNGSTFKRAICSALFQSVHNNHHNGMKTS